MTQVPAQDKPEPIITRLARLSRSDVTPDEYLKSFFALARAALAAEGGGIWIYNSETRQLVSKVSAAAESGPAKGIPEDFLTKVVYRAIEEKKPVLYYPDETSDSPELKNVSVTCVPFEVDDKATVIMLLAREAAEGRNFTPENVHILLSLGAYLPVYFMNVQLRLSSAMAARLAKLAEIESDLAAAVDRVKMAFIIANRSREMLFFDRVFVAFPRGQSFRVEAVSGIDDAQQKSAAVRDMAEVTAQFARLGGDWHFTPAYLEKVEDSGLRDKLTVYFETNEYKSVLLTRVEDARGLLAVIGYERRQEGTYTPQDLTLLQTVGKAFAKPLRRAEEYRSLPGIRAVEAVSRLKTKALGPQRHRFYIKVASTALVIAVLLLGRMELYVRGECRIIPYMTSYAAARMAGTVREVRKNEQDHVAKGDIIAVLDDREVENAIRQTEAEIEQKKAAIDYYAGSNIANWSLEKKNLEILQLRLEGYRLQKDYTQVISPQDGVIITPRDRINASLNASVKRGEAICEIADPAKVYVEVEIRERDIGLVKTGQPMEFALAGSPGRTFRTTVSSISPNSRQVLGKNVFIAQGLLDNSDGGFRLGVTGSADIPSGRRPIGYVIFRSTIDWLYSKLL